MVNKGGVFMDQIKEWLFKDNEEFNEISVHYYQLQKTTELKGVANDLKNGSIVLCHIDDSILTRVLDFVDGIIYIKNIQKIQINQNIYMFLPQDIHYKSIS